MGAANDPTLPRRLPRAAAWALLAAFALLAGRPAAGADDEPGLWEALKDGKASVDLRYRYEGVRQDGFGKDARASTLRTVVGYRTRIHKGFSLQLEAENVAVLGNDLYANAGAGGLDNGVRDRPVVADPASTGINQALLHYRANRWRLAAGRQEIVLGDARFVGNVGWRQNHQSFDALRLDGTLGGLRFTYAWVDRVNRIFGDGQELTGHLLNVTFDLQNVGRFTAYGYLLDYDEAITLSTSTVGLEFAGKRRLPGGRSLLYEIEHAEQSDHADNPNRVAAGYTTLVLGAELPRATVKAGLEVLDGSPADGRFRTPLATLHAHNGWADTFLATPPDGLEDLYLQAEGKLGKLGWLVGYHDFSAESGPLSYGRELDLQLLYTSPGGVLLGLKGAFYDADAFASDTDKLTLWAAYGF